MLPHYGIVDNSTVDLLTVLGYTVVRKGAEPPTGHTYGARQRESPVLPTPGQARETPQMSTPTSVESITLRPSVLADLQSVVDRVAKRTPKLASRAYRAGILLASGAVTPVRLDLYEVRGTEPRPYAVDLLAETCSCSDFQHAAPEYRGAKWC